MITHKQFAVGFASVLVLSLAGNATIGRDGADWDKDAAGRYLDGRAKTWFEYAPANRGKAESRTSCVCCHTIVPFALSRSTLRKLTATAEPTEFETKLLTQTKLRVANWAKLDTPDFALLYSSSDEKKKESWGTEAVLNALILATDDRAAGRNTPSEPTRQAFVNLWKTQIADGPNKGAWDWLNFNYAPWENPPARYFGATLAAIATGIAPGSKAADASVDRLRDYLKREFANQNLHNRAWALQAASVLEGILTAEQKQDIVSQLSARQQADGGWSLASLGDFNRVDGTPQETTSDGYATGLVLHSLQIAGQPKTDANVSRGLAWLKANQQPGGEWRAASLNKKRDPSTHVGKFMADAATGMAVLALGR